ncbi:MAG: CRISPR-associated endonuclease Cas2 [Deltaproteobacteria bacterium]|nr:CRISPR-associated endonuclease Cas2 [Deltaproteobacteria bacterium]
MGTEALHIVASYDISDPKRLARVAKAMKGYGERVLKSVFECNLDRRRFGNMKIKMDELIEPIEDSVRYYILCEKCVRVVEYSGKGEGFQQDEDYVVV